MNFKHLALFLKDEPRLWAIKQDWRDVHIVGKRLRTTNSLKCELCIGDLWITGTYKDYPYVYLVDRFSSQRNLVRYLRTVIEKLNKPGLEHVIKVHDNPPGKHNNSSVVTLLRPPLQSDWQKFFAQLMSELQGRPDRGIV